MMATNTVAVMTEAGRSWVRVGGTRTWRLAKPEDIRRLSEELDPSAKASSKSPTNDIVGWKIFGLTMACIMLVFILAIIVVLLVKMLKKERRRPDFSESRQCEQFADNGQISDGMEDEAESFSVRL